MAEPMTYYKPIRRIRQACHNCRRKKARCPGQKPACSFCVRLGQACSYSDDEQFRAPSQQTTASSSTAVSVSSTQRHKGRVRSRMGSASTARSTPEPTTDAELSEALSAPVQSVTPYMAKSVQQQQNQQPQPSPDISNRIMAMEMQMSSLANSIKSLESTLAKFATTMTETLSVHTRSTSATNTATPTQDAMDMDGMDTSSGSGNASTDTQNTTTAAASKNNNTTGAPNADGPATTVDQASAMPYTRLPPPDVIDAAADLYFRYCHNQPYSLFHEASFRQKIKARTVPTHLLFALVASTVRYSSDNRFFAGVTGGRAAATVAYAQQSWRAIVVPWNGLQSDAELSVVQTILLLAIIDYTEGRTQASWIKVGLAIRLCQDFRLMVEPDASLPPAHQEERRRVFWSFYLCDKLISCGRERPATILDDHCRLRLPCDEDVWRSDTLPDAEQRPPTLGQLTADADGGGPAAGGGGGGGSVINGGGSVRHGHSPAWSDSGITTTELSQLSPFAVTVLVTSLLGRCAQYALGEQEEQTSSGRLPPWSPRSKYSALHSAVLHLESELGLNEPVATKIARCCLKPKSTSQGESSSSAAGDMPTSTSNGATTTTTTNSSDEMRDELQQEIDSHRAAPLAFSHAIFYLCQCLLYHPFLMWQRLAGVGQRTPQSFVLHTLSACHNAARALSQLMGDIRSLQTPLLTTSYDPFYGYSNMVAGVVHVLFLEAADPGVRQAAAAGYAASLENLENLSVYWKSCARMRARLHDFHLATQTALAAGRPRFAHIVDPDPAAMQRQLQQQQPPGMRLDPTDANDLMECMDYARMSTTTRRRTQLNNNITNSNINNNPSQASVASGDVAGRDGSASNGGASSSNNNNNNTPNNGMANGSGMNSGNNNTMPPASAPTGYNMNNTVVVAGMNGASHDGRADLHSSHGGYDTLPYGLGGYGGPYGGAGAMYAAGGGGGGGGGGDDSSSGGTGLTPLSQLPSPFFEELVNLLPFPTSRPMTPRHFDAMFEQAPVPQSVPQPVPSQVGAVPGRHGALPKHGSDGVSSGMPSSMSSSMQMVNPQHAGMSPYHPGRASYGGPSGPGNVLGFP
ncbi:hypothetical protein SBRCBS47491_010091 [Sporothrix bragantina]|uniref:Zn(2)-C6 fungal-type domain-containing protein n=1 Tax=Sporothrix bragantina TaxID=671064 RepID=A0ABP0D1P8_9PEZI